MDDLVAPVDFSGRLIGPQQPCFIIAEAGVNHNGDVAMARRLVDAAVSAGADAVKFQAFKAERLASAVAPKAEYQAKATGAGESQLDMLRRLELSEAAHQELWAYCRTRGIRYLCTPFDEASSDFLVRLGVGALKIPSGEVTNLPLLSHVARHQRLVILSTGMSTQAEVAAAVDTLRAAGNPPLIVLHCVSAYPAEPAEANLRAMHTLSEALRLPVGYSDHTPGIAVAMAAAALGACVIEKHLTLDKTLPGPDHQMSLDPEEFAALVQGIRTVEAALGHGRKEPAPRELDTAAVARKSLVSSRAVAVGTRLTPELVAVKRPGTGLPPAMLERVLGRVAVRDIPADALLTLDMFTDA